MKSRILIILLAMFSLASGEKTMLNLTDTAPVFSLSDQNGNTYNLDDFKGKKYVVLIFYPGDETPVCTQQLCEIRDDYQSFSDNDAVVFGINPADTKSHQKFATKNNFQFPLLIDNDKKVAAAYHAKGLFLNQRTVYVIDKNGKIIFAKRGKPSVQAIIASFKGKNSDSLNIDLQK